LVKLLKILLLTLVAIFATEQAIGQTNSTDPQVVCIGYVGAYQVDYLENSGAGTLGSTYDWTVITPGFLGTITTNQGPLASENRIIIDWGTTPIGIYVVEIIETTNGCVGAPVLLNVEIVPNTVGTDVQTACNSYTWIDGITYNASTNTPTFTIVGGSVLGCDSIVTLNLTINNVVTGTDVQTACNSYTWIDGITYNASTNTPTFTIVGGSSTGCDSIVTLDLTINNIVTGTDVQTACNNYTWIDGITYNASTNTPTFTIVGGSVSGCDSIVTLNLTINNVVTGTDVQTACNSYTWIDGITYNTSTNTPTFTIVGGSVAGCDSIVTLNLTINNVVTGTDVQTACSNYTWIDGITYNASTNTPTFTIVGGSVSGCDSIVTLDLTINNVVTGTDVQTACNAYTWIDGITYNASTNTPTFTIVGGSVSGCDSIVTLNLTINNVVTGTDVQTACNSYTWIDGITYNASTITPTFTIVGGGASGCDSIVTLVLTINNVVTGTDVQTACNNYTWIDGITYNASTNTPTFTIVGGSVSGCDSVVTLDLTINNVVTGTDVQTACNNYTWIDGITYNASTNTPTFTIVGGSSTGCDSIVTLDLTINNVVTGTDVQTACNNYTWIDGITYNSSTNTPTFTIVGGSVSGCDSIVTLDLTINNVVTGIDVQTACNTYTWIDGITYNASINTPTFTIVGGGSTGCDSIVTLDLTINNVVTGTDVQTACNAYTWIDGITYNASTNTPTFTIVGGSVSGCDSIVTLNLTINNVVTGTDVQTACNSYTWIDGITYNASTITPTFTIVGGGASGCDSIVTLVLTINNVVTGTDVQTACNNYTWIDGITYNASTNTPTFTIVGGSAAGCDSIVTLDLTINNVVTGTDVQTACNLYTWIDGITYNASTNTPTFTIVGGSSTGCDSIVTLDLTINNVVTGTDIQTACNSYTWIDGITYNASTNTPTFTIVGGSVSGCDSIVTLNLTINNVVTGTDVQTACNSYTWIDGITYNASTNTPTFTIVGGSSAGCDSIVTLNLTINNIVTGTDVQTACNNYTWIDGITYNASTITPTFTIVGGGASGCDSIVTLVLTINNVVTGTDVQTACNTYTWIDGITYNASTNTPTFTIVGGSVSGCDSIVTLDLTINNVVTGTDVQTACNTYTWIDGITYNASTNTPTFTIAGGSSTGCDSIVTLDLTINNVVTGTDVQTACNNYTWIDGITYNSSTNTPTFTIVGGSVSGCDSIVTLDLTINNVVTGIDVQTACNTYTWIDGITYNASTNTPTFTIVGGSVNGCDSIVTLDLTINNIVTGTDVQTACNNYTWIDGITYNASTNTPTFTIVGGSVAGCDSIVTLDLTINNVVTGTDVQTACNNYTWIDGITYNASTNTPTFTIVGGSAAGCDSIVTLDLTINNVVTGTDVQTACNSYTWIDGITYNASTNTPTFTIVGGGASGCDSIVTLVLTINNVVTSTDVQTACNTYIWIDGITYNASTNTPTFTIAGGSVAGCDSIVTLDLTINNFVTGTDVQTACNSYTWIDGITYNTSTNTPTFTIVGGSAAGCDSIVTLDLTINNVVTGTDVQTACNSYTWIDGITYNASTNTPTFTIVGGGASGCDSIVTLVLTINNVVTGTDVQTACNTYTWIDGITYNTSTNTPTFTIVGGSVTGCDSIVTLDLTINNVVTGTDVQTACNSYTWIDGITYNTSTNTPTFTILGGSVTGCDSIVTLDLTINNVVTGTDVQTACNSYTWIDGITYNASTNTPTFTIVGGGSTGCDSIVTLDLTINNFVAGTDVQTACNTYTWIDGITYNASTNTPTFTIVGGSVNGCDSIVTLDLTINNVVTGTDVQTACNSYTWIDGITYNTSTNTPTFTILGGSVTGCDSIVTLDLTINNVVTGTDVQTACNSYTWIDGITYNASTNTPTFTIVGGGSTGCDSIVTLDLTINNFVAGTDVQTACNTYTWIDGITYNASTNTPTFTIVGGSVNGCDSIVTLDLTINNVVTGTDVQTACNSYTWIDGITYNASTNTPTFTIAGGSVSGCDSIVTLNLTINNVVTGTDVQTACSNYTWIDGITYNASTNTPTFTIVGGSVSGCDSIVTLNLTINNVVTGTDVQTACNSYTWIDGITYNASTNTPTFTIVGGSSAGCDSIVTLNLTINNIVTGTDVQTACNNYTWIDGITYNASTNTPTFTIVGGGSTGCDSIVTLDLTINNFVTGTDVQTACNTYTWIDGITYNASTNTPTFTIVGGSVAGCDSIVTLNLTINNVVTGTDVQTACNSYTWIDGITYNASTNTPTFTIVGGSVNGCDSIVTLDLTINNVVTGTDIQTACNSYTWIDGITYNASTNTPTFTIVDGSSTGCDSIVTLDLTINNVVTGTDVQTACNLYTWIDGITYNASTNTPTFTILGGSVNGCDSIVTLDLTINNVVTGTDIQTACNSYTWIDGITYSATTNTPTFTIVGGSVSGCDSIVTLNLTINNVVTGTDVQTACNSYTWIDGITYNASTNTPTFTIVGGGASGCDSIVTLVLTINNVFTGADVQTACNTYTWIDGITYNASTNTPTFTITGGSVAGCDSIVTLDLTINNFVTGTDVQTACNSYTWIDGITYNASTNTPTFTIVGGGSTGCDSIVTLDLTINNFVTGTDVQTACNSYTWIDGITYNTSTNTPTFTILGGSVTGCDSIVTLDLTINNVVTGTDVQTACNSYTWIDGITYNASTNTPTFTIVGGGSTGCDSIVTLDLTINNFVAGTDVQTACNTYTWIDGITYNASTNTPTFTIVGGSVNGCDSIVTLDLTINNFVTGTDIQTACNSYTWIDGITYNASTNTPTFTIVGGSSTGCDSIVILNLTINNVVTGTDVQTACNSYTWIDGITYNASTNTPTFIIVGGGSSGCDSIVTLVLTINNVVTGADVQTACNTYTWIDGITYNASTNTPTFTITGGSVAGCDSIVTLDLTINNFVTGTDVETACNSYTWIDGITYNASTNTPTFTIVGGGSTGCDSIVTLDLTINNFVTGTDVQTACNTYTWIDGITYNASTNTPTFTIVGGGSTGCDSIVTLDLTINNFVTGTDVQTACNSYTWIDGITYNASTNTPTFTIVGGGSTGCDSIVTLDLTINNFVTGTDVQTACNSYTWIDGITYNASTNTPTFTIVGGGASGCDSIVTLVLTINNVVTGTDVQTACNSYTWIDGITYNASTNTPTFTIVGGSVSGCDSIVTLDLTINNVVTGTDVQTACNTYTWIDGITYNASINTPTFTIVGGSVSGCDSIVTLNLTISNVVTGTDVQTACNTYTWIDGITYNASTNTPTFTFVGGSVSGCDSIVTLNLTINNVVTGTDVQTACNTYTWIDGITYNASTNTPTFTIVGGGASGCDSIVTLVLTINNVVTGTDVQTACNAYTWIDGITYNASTNTPTFTIVGGSAAGCDSIVTLDLTINNVVTGTDVQTACNSYTWIDGITYNASTNTPTFTIVGGGASGCDSIVTLVLTINNVVTGTDVQTACNTYTWIDGITYNTSTNTPTFTIVGGSVTGCDSIVTLDLTINNVVTGTDVQTACNSYTWIDGITYNASTNTPTFTIVGGGSTGCDSIVTLNLTISNVVTGTDVQTACNTYTWIDGITYNASTNTPTFTIVGGSVNGCDSIVTLDLTINNVVTGTDIQTACNSYTWIDGITYSATTNTPTFTIVGGSVSGCDSIVILNLTINNVVTGTDVQTACNSYTWIDGITYNASTNTPTFIIVGGGSSGCDSIVTLVLTINNVVTGADVQTACNTYTWIDGITYNASTNTPTFTITGGSVAGCDSIVTLDLTINNFVTGTDVETACNSYTWIDGITYNASTNTPTFTIVGGGSTGCDSIVTLDLTINNFVTGTDVQTACNTYTWIDGITYNASTNTPTFTIVGGGASGCDSIVTLVLTINNVVTGTDVQTACNSYTWIDGITYNASINTPTFTIVGGSVAGCDSIVTLDLIINNFVTGTDVQTACNSYTWIDGITYNASTNTPTFTIAGGSVAGCDSIVTLDLTINNFVTGTDVQTACNTYTWIDGITYNASINTPTFTIVGGGSTGCDSIVTLDLTINNFVTGTDVQTACNTYTWIDGITYNASINTPTFTIVGGGSTGCDSIVTLDLTINNFVTGTDVQTACNTYTWIDGITYNASINTPTFTIVGGSVSGCDSIVTLDLTINNFVTGTDVQTACNSYTWIDGITYNASTNTPTFTIVGGGASGCDSIVTLVLTINNVVTGTDVQTACNSYTWIDGITYNASINTPTFTIVGGSVAGCDSIVTLDLIINNFVTGTDVQTACNSYTWIDGITYNASTNTPTFTIAGGSVAGCDSIVTLDLTINNFVTGTDVQTACNTYTWIDGITYNASTNTPTFTIVGGGSTGCDSIVTLNLTINNFVTGTDVQTACNTYTWIDGITYNASINTPTFTIVGGSVSGCDSIVTLDLTINNFVTGTDVQTACNSYTWIDGIAYNASTNTPTFTIAGGSVAGCDSIVTLDLTINNFVTGTDVQTACNTYTWIDGITYNASINTPTFTIVGGSVSGCDSIVTLDLTINNFVTGTDVQTACNTYTWIDGITYNASTNTPTFTIVGGGSTGCDSIVTLDLTINNFVTGTDVQTACNTYTWIDGITYNASINTPTFTIVGGSVSGCDSIVTLDLTINNFVTGTDVQMACNSYTWIDGITYNASTNTPTFTIVGGGSTGCDSIVTLDLTINNYVTGTDVQTACNTYTWIDGITYNASTNTPTFTIVGGSVSGCDSIVTLDLTINNFVTGTDVQTACNSYTWIDGITYNASTNTPTFTIVGGSAAGCDSIVTLDLTINNFVTGIDVQTAVATYTWIDGNTYNSSTNTPTFIIIGGASNGCDSIVTLNLTIINSVTGIDIQTACDSFTWIDGITYNTSTNTPTFTIVGGSAQGTDSIVTLNLTIINAVASIDSQTACDSFVWIDGITYNTSTNLPTFIISAGATNGCDSIINLNLTINNSSNTNVNTQICSGQLYILPDGSSVGSAGIYTDTLIANSGCDSIIVTNLQLLPTFNVNLNAQICAGQNYILPDGSSTAIAGTYNFTLPSSAGCDSVVQVNLGVLSLSFDTINAQVCNSQPYQLPNGTIVNSPGIYDVIFTNQIGCDSIITTVLTDGNNLVANVQIASSPSGPICYGDPVTFTAGSINGGTTPMYQWFVNGIAVPGQTLNEFISFTLNDSDLVSVELISNEPCVSNPISISNIITQEVTIPLTTTISIITNQQFPACSGRPITFTSFIVNGGANPSYQWFINGVAVQGGTNDTLIVDSLENNDIVTLNAYSDLECISNTVAYSNSIIVTLIQSIAPTINITSNDTVICEQQMVTFIAHINGAGSSAVQLYWYVNNALISVGPDTIFSYNSFANQDSVTCQLVSTYICVNPPVIASNPIIITVHDNPIVDMIYYQYNMNICDTLQLITSTNIVDPVFDWHANASLSCNNCINPFTTTKLDTTWYFVTVLDPKNGCFTEDSTIVYLNPEPEVFLPSAFSPNGDENNDMLFIRGNCIKEVTLKVYDRWGELVFVTESIETGWDGTYKGKDAAAAVYVYIIDYVLYNDKIKHTQGNITLIR
jgi:gliding motility-associated-like protein